MCPFIAFRGFPEYNFTELVSFVVHLNHFRSLFIDTTTEVLLCIFRPGSSPSPSAAASAHIYADSDPLLGATRSSG